MSTIALTAADVALLEAHAQDTVDLLARLRMRDRPLDIPPAALAAVERVRADRISAGVYGHILLRVDDPPPGIGRSPSWRVIAGEAIVASSARKVS